MSWNDTKHQLISSLPDSPLANSLFKDWTRLYLIYNDTAKSAHSV
jgi:hypothetical protein